MTYEAEGRTEFRTQHNLAGKYVVMYSGNHSPCHPLDTLLQAAQKLSHQPGVMFCFVGGGSEHTKVKAFASKHKLKNILCLPYQPLNKLANSLSAADLHAVVMGDAFYRMSTLARSTTFSPLDHRSSTSVHPTVMLLI